MPSPLAHLTAGYVVYEVYRRKRPHQDKKRIGPVSLLLIIVSILSLLPDVDSAAGILTGDFGRYHNNLTHSLLVGVGVSLAISSLISIKDRANFTAWFIISLISYNLHIVLDFFTYGRGVMAFWPLSSERFLSPVTLFYGLHWSDGWLSIRHLLTLVTEVGFVALVGIVVFLHHKRKGRIPTRSLREMNQ